jgi:hypothetical protein
MLPARAKRKSARAALFKILLVLMLILAALAAWQWRTISLILNPDKIQLKQGHEIRAALLSGVHGPVTADGGSISYLALDNSVEITVDFDSTDSFRRLEAQFNAHEVPAMSVPEALREAQKVLSPYLGKDEVKAVSVLLGAELPNYVFTNEVDYRREIGPLTITVKGRMDTGEMRVICYEGIEVAP